MSVSFCVLCLCLDGRHIAIFQSKMNLLELFVSLLFKSRSPFFLLRVDSTLKGVYRIISFENGGEKSTDDIYSGRLYEASLKMHAKFNNQWLETFSLRANILIS